MQTCTWAFHHVKLKAEIRCDASTQAKEHQRLPPDLQKLGKSHGTDLSHHLQEEPALLTPQFLISGLLSWETMCLYCLSHPVCGYYDSSPGQKNQSFTWWRWTSGGFGQKTRAKLINCSGGNLCSVAQLCPTLYHPIDCSLRPPLSMGLSWQEYWRGLPFPSPGDLPNPGDRTCISCISCTGRQILYHGAP